MAPVDDNARWVDCEEAKSENPTLRERRSGWGTQKGERQSEKPHPSQKTFRMGHPERRKAKREADPSLRSPKAGDRVRDDKEVVRCAALPKDGQP